MKKNKNNFPRRNAVRNWNVFLFTLSLSLFFSFLQQAIKKEKTIKK